MTDERRERARKARQTRKPRKTQEQGRIRLLTLLVLLLLALGATAAGLVVKAWYTPLANLNLPSAADTENTKDAGGTVEFLVEPGSSLTRVSQQLAAAGYLQQPRLFVLLARLQGLSDDIKAGEYHLPPGTTPVSLLRRMVAGDTIQYRVTLVEGWTFQQALQAIQEAEKIAVSDAETIAQAIAAAAADANIPGMRGEDNEVDTSENNQTSMEGLIFPDTYFYTAGTSDIEILQRAQTQLQTILAETWAKKYGGLPLANPYEALILASIVEKESGIAAERGVIAGVFINRLELGMRLQSDPTILYGKTGGFEGNITRLDLDTPAPYNTYQIDRLPPTPIALVSREALQATLRPEMVEYLYFVSKGDGSHQFSVSLAEHNAAVDKYQRKPNRNPQQDSQQPPQRPSQQPPQQNPQQNP